MRRTTLRAAAAAACAAAFLACTELHVSSLGQAVSVRMTPDTVILRIGDSAKVVAAPLDPTSAILTQKLPAWSSSAPSVVSVDTDGHLKGLSAGTATLSATVDGVSGTAYIVVTGQPATIVATAGGGGQTAAVNAMTPVAPAVKVTDAGGNPVPNASVTFSPTGGGGAVNPAGAVLTGLDGVATLASWTLGPSAGLNTMTATVSGAGVTGNPVNFTATGTHGPPSATMSSIAASPTSIPPSNGLAFSTITVTVRDSAGSTITGATVVLSATGSGNQLSQPVDTTNAQGQVTGALSSSGAGTKTISAVVNGTVTLTQTATVDVSASAPAGLAVANQPGGAVSNALFTAQPKVEIRDGFGNVVPSVNVPVTVSLVSGNGTLISQSGTFTVNAVNGVATFSGLRIRGTRTTGDTLGTGPHVLQFSAPGYSAVKSDTLQVGVSFSYNIADILARNGCVGCHGFTYANTVGVAATSAPCAPQIRVTASDTVSSVLYQKIRTPTPTCGSVMPTSGQMSATQIRLVRDWILQGAPNN